MKWLLIFILAGSIFSGRRTYGQDQAAPDPNEEVRAAARLAFVQGVNWLKQKAEADPDGWIIGPNRFIKVIGYTNITVRYSRRTVWDPVYSYTNVVVFTQDTVGAPLRKTIQRRIVKRIGSNEVERLVHDPQGPIAQEQPHPLYDRGGNISWATRNIGDAALALHALRRAGIPDSDPVMQGVLINLRNHISTFGLPDQTWNLAWLTAVFAGTPGDEAADLTRRLASRLMDGQMMDREARGFWGTLSVHHGLLAAMLRDYLAMLADLQKKELRLKEKPGKAAQAAVDEIKESMDWHRTITEREICQRGFRFGNVESSWAVDPNADPKVLLAGADHLLYNQTVTDMESTWAALLALSMAAEHGRLPTETWRPKLARKPGATISPLPPPERSEAVLARAANALAAKQARDGRWSECNQHQPVTKFDAFKTTLPVPSDPESFLPLSSPVTALSTAQGIAALDSVGAVVGMNRLQSSFGGPYRAGVSAAQSDIAARLKAVWPSPIARPKFNREDYDLLLVLTHPLKGATDQGAATPDPDSLVRALVLAANPTGTWGKGLAALSLPSSSRARAAALKENAGELNKAHIAALHTTGYLEHFSPLLREAEGLCTAIAVLYLAGYVDNPAATLEELAALPDLDAQRKEAVLQLTVRKPPKPVVKPASPVPSPAGAPPATPEESDVPDAPVAPVDDKPKADETL